MNVQLTIYGHPPAKSSGRMIITNKRTGRPMVLSSNKTRQYEKDFAAQIMEKHREIKDYDGPLSVVLKVYANSRRQDIDSFPKVVFDCLQKNGVIKNDNRIEHMVVTREVDKENPRVEIAISAISQPN